MIFIWPPSCISEIQESAEIEQKVIKTNKGTQSWAKNIKITVRKIIFSEKNGWPKIGCHGNIEVYKH